jgi:hypothetical protein
MHPPCVRPLVAYVKCNSSDAVASDGLLALLCELTWRACCRGWWVTRPTACGRGGASQGGESACQMVGPFGYDISRQAHARNYMSA